MIIRCYGARGSVPVSGPQYLKYGGDTSCVEIVSAGGSTVIVDAGSGMRRLADRLIEDGRLAIHLLITHAHWDHIIGFTVFKLNYLDDADITVWHPPRRRHDIRDTLERLMHPPGFPIHYRRLNAAIRYEQHPLAPFQIDGVTVHPITVNHTNPAMGYRFEEHGRRFAMLTDNELGYPHPLGESTETYTDFATDADLLFHDAQFTPEEYPAHAGWGHSTHMEALALAMDAGVRRLGLFHHSPERTDDALDRMVADCRARIAAAGSTMDCFAVRQDMEIVL